MIVGEVEGERRRVLLQLEEMSRLTPPSTAATGSRARGPVIPRLQR